jgi:heme exporter protein C
LPIAPSTSTAFPGRNASAPVRWLAAGAVLLGLVALAIGLGGPDRTVRDWTIFYIHVPAAWLSLLLYGAAVAVAAATMRLPSRLAPEALFAIAPVGAAAGFVALWTGLTSQHGRGAGWGLDARLVAELVLLLLFGALIAVQRAIEDPVRAQRAGSVLVLVGALNIPSIYVSVNWWDALHERAAASVGRSPLVITVMALMTMAFCMYAGAVVLARLEAFARERETGTRNFGSARAEGASARTPAKEQQ